MAIWGWLKLPDGALAACLPVLQGSDWEADHAKGRKGMVYLMAAQHWQTGIRLLIYETEVLRFRDWNV